MPRTSDKRQRLRDAAFGLARERGIVGWTLADVADAAGVPAGSVYYHFRTKESMVGGVVEALDAHFAAALAGCESGKTGGDARGSLFAFIDLYAEDAIALRATGPALGSLGADLRRSAPQTSEAIAAVYARVMDWLATQFTSLGFPAGAARARGLHLLTGLEGAAALAHALDSTEPLERETAHLRRWVERATPA